MLDVHINKWPIVIITYPRTGSTALAEYLAKKYQVPAFLEPWYPYDKRNAEWGEEVFGVKKNFYDFYRNKYNRKYVLKIFANQINHFTPYEQILSTNCFKIKLTRENFIDNCVSRYIAENHKKWWQFKNEIVEPYTVKIDTDIMINSIAQTSFSNYLTNNLNINWDLELTYESLNFEQQDEYAKTFPPLNL
jgi:hypothetical protein